MTIFMNTITPNTNSIYEEGGFKGLLYSERGADGDYDCINIDAGSIRCLVAASQGWTKCKEDDGMIQYRRKRKTPPADPEVNEWGEVSP